jgi:hypothetical protein
LSRQAIASPILVLIHLVGLTMFVGSILGNVVLSLGAPATGDSGTVVFAWRAIASANTFLTIPGLVILIGSGARASFTEVALRQQIYGAVNLALIVLASALVVFKPRLGGTVPRRLRR